MNRVPLLRFGLLLATIRSSLIGAFMVHGLQPGPMMFILNVDIIYGLFIGLIVSSVFLCIFSVFAVNNNIFDVGLMFVIG